VAVAGAVFVGTCTADSTPDAPDLAGELLVEQLDSAGVEIVINGRVGRWGSGPFEFERTLRIGVVEGEDAYQFHGVSGVAVDPEGMLYVANGQSATIRIFDAEGRFLREMGGKGSGPGEFQTLSGVVITERGVAAIDGQLLRVTEFTNEGEALETWRYAAAGLVNLRHWTPQGWLGMSMWNNRPAVAPTGTPDTTRYVLNRLTEDTVVPVPGIELPPSVRYRAPAGRGWDWPLFEATSATGVDAIGRVFVSRGTTYQVDLFSPAGALVRRVRREHEPTLVGSEAIAEHLELLREAYRRSDESPAQSAGQVRLYEERIAWQSTFPMAEHLPPTRRMLVGRDGSFWLERTDDVSPARLELERAFARSWVEERLGSRPSTWDLFDPDGHLLGQIRIPSEFTPHAVEGHIAVEVERGEMDVEYVVRYEVRVPRFGRD
jgi:hypothetical protein